MEVARGAFGQLRELRELWLDHNQLTILPGTFGQLRQLRELWPERNQLTALPDTFGQLRQLRELRCARGLATSGACASRFVALCTPVSLFHRLQQAAAWDDIRYLVLDEV